MFFLNLVCKYAYYLQNTLQIEYSTTYIEFTDYQATILL